jgi:hypothetical protein
VTFFWALLFEGMTTLTPGQQVEGMQQSRSGARRDVYMNMEIENLGN